jgi:hypothetical protein
VGERYRHLEAEITRLRYLRGGDLVDAVLPANEGWADPLRAIAATIDAEEFDAQALRDTLRAGITQPELPTDVNYVRLMSLDKSKGLTSDLVVVVAVSMVLSRLSVTISHNRIVNARLKSSDDSFALPLRARDKRSCCRVQRIFRAAWHIECGSRPATRWRTHEYDRLSLPH